MGKHKIKTINLSRVLNVGVIVHFLCGVMQSNVATQVRIWFFFVKIDVSHFFSAKFDPM